jgi:calcium-binding protein CML
VREVDRDNDGFIDVEEFAQLNKMVSEATQGEDDETQFMQEAFHVFDIDGDGYISAGELYRVLSGLGEAGLTVEQCGAMIQNVDKDGNGLVDFSEFKCLMQDARVC